MNASTFHSLRSRWYEGQKNGKGDITFSHDFTYDGVWREGQFSPSSNTRAGFLDEIDVPTKQHMVDTVVRRNINSTLSHFKASSFDKTHPLFDKLNLFKLDNLERDEQVKILFENIGQEIMENDSVPAVLEKIILEIQKATARRTYRQIKALISDVSIERGF